MRILFFTEWLLCKKKKDFMRDFERQILNARLGVRRKIVIIRKYQEQLIPDAVETGEEIYNRIFFKTTIS